MNRKGEKNELVFSTVVYLIFAAAFVFLLGAFVFQQMNGAGVWEDFYAKEIVKVINLAQQGDEINLDIHKGSVIGKKNEVNFNEMFKIDNEKNEVCVRLSAGRKSCYSFFNDVDVAWEVKLGVPENVLVLKIGGGK